MRSGLVVRRWLPLGALALLGLLAGCTESHDVEPKSDDAGRGGAGTGGGGGGSGDGNCDTGCSGTSVFGVTVPGCCTDDGKCGLDIGGLGFGAGCAELNAPGSADSACPSQTLGGLITLQGCCKPDGTCGVLDDIVGLGCASAGATQVTTCQP